MERRIIVYGLDKSEEARLQTDNKVEEWIRSGIFRDENGRFGYRQNKIADIIVLTRGNHAYGHFEVGPREQPTPEDERIYSRVKYVYPVRKSVLYKKKVPLGPLGITVPSWGKHIEEEFKEILSEAGGCETFTPERGGLHRLINIKLEIYDCI